MLINLKSSVRIRVRICICIIRIRIRIRIRIHAVDSNVDIVYLIVPNCHNDPRHPFAAAMNAGSSPRYFPLLPYSCDCSDSFWLYV